MRCVAGWAEEVGGTDLAPATSSCGHRKWLEVWGHKNPPLTGCHSGQFSCLYSNSPTHSESQVKVDVIPILLDHSVLFPSSAPEFLYGRGLGVESHLLQGEG